MKIFKSKENFIPKSQEFEPNKAVIIANTDYSVVESNMASGIMITGYDKDVSHAWQTYISPEEIHQYSVDQPVLTIEVLRSYLNKIHFLPSCVNFTWGWEIVEFDGHAYDENGVSTGKQNGFLINTTFQRPDIKTGAIGTGRGRRMWIEDTASETSVVMTAYICCDLIVKHELFESLTYGGAKILNPHKTIEQLAYPETIEKI